MAKGLMFYIRNNKSALLIIPVLLVIVYSCANMASPSGGDYDFDPPKIVRTSPLINATNVTPGRIEIVFDELVQIKDVGDKVIVTPPQKMMPSIQAISNKIVVQLRDTLLPNTTYTIDFTDAIVDNNEGNPFENFAFSFSTGGIIDTLVIAGKVLDANTLEPIKGLFVGLHSDLSDSAFISKPFERISRTNDRGEFIIRGIAENNYRIYALEDVSRTYIYENRESLIAFLDTIITPSFIEAFREDTIFNKDMTIDSIMTVKFTRFLPDNIVLRSFSSSVRRQYLQKYERNTDNEVRLFFGAPTQLAEIRPLNFERNRNEDWMLMERSAKNDSLLFWITDPEIAKLDTIRLEVTYNITDSIYNIVSKTDTLNFIDRNRKRREQAKEKEKNKKKKDQAAEINFLPVTISSVSNLYDTLRITFGQPVYNFDENKLTLHRLVDTTFVEQTFVVKENPYNPRTFSVIHKWEPGASYKLTADSAAFNSFWGQWTNKINSTFQIKKLDQYGDLYINLTGIEYGTPAFVELLNSSDKPVRKSTVKYKDGEAGVLFMNLPPNKYYARIIIDRNNNEQWDTGDFYTQTQPEEVFYYNRFFEIKPLWQQEEVWNIGELPLDKQKPLEITKNKPKEKESRRKQLEAQEEKSKSQNNNNSLNDDQFNNLNRNLLK